MLEKSGFKFLGGVEYFKYKLTILPIEHCEVDYFFFHVQCTTDHSVGDGIVWQVSFKENITKLNTTFIRRSE